MWMLSVCSVASGLCRGEIRALASKCSPHDLELESGFSRGFGEVSRRLLEFGTSLSVCSTSGL
jgi:hypothetical protein